MVRHRWWALLLGLLVSAIAVSPVRARDERPLTEAELAAAQARVEQARRYLASVPAVGTSAVQGLAACPGPTGGEGAIGPSGSESVTGPRASAPCYVPAGVLQVHARDQPNGLYCGPAVGQVISNYAWVMSSSANKFTQDQLAAWMKTNVRGLTDSPELAAGLNVATRGSPRQPANWTWVVLPFTDAAGRLIIDYNGNWTGSDEFHGFVRSNISDSRMPLAVSVKPHAKHSQYGQRLTSWPKPVNSVGHWIAIYGWYGYWDGTSFPRIYYTDSSKDEGGGTGKYWQSSHSIYLLIRDHTNRIVW